MAFTYRIKPVHWDLFLYRYGEAFKSRKHGYLVYLDNDGDWSAIFSDTEYDAFPTEEQSKTWIEERHIAKVREYLEALE